MNVHGEITEKDYLRAQWLHIKPRRGYRIAGYVVLSLFLISAIGVLITSISRGDPQPLFGFFLPVVVILLVGLLLRRQHRRIYRSQPALRGNHTYRFTDAGFSAESPHGRGEASWSAFTKWREDSNLFLLYKADNMFHVLPKRWFGQDTAAMEEFRTLLESRSLPRAD